MFPAILFPVLNLNLDIPKSILWDIVIITFISIVNSVLSVFFDCNQILVEEMKNTYQIFCIDSISIETVATNFIFRVFLNLNLYYEE